MKRVLTVAGLLALTVGAFSVVASMKTFDAAYGIKPDSKIGSAKCVTCHLTNKGGKLNPFGKDIQAAMKEAGTKKLSADILKKVEKLDSDGDGMSNIDEIKADRMPGAKG